jgi:hypothetical protein
MMTTSEASAPRRKLETTAQAAHRALMLHQKVSFAPPPAVPAATRARVAVDPELARLCAAAQRALFGALAAVPPELAAGVRNLACDPSFQQLAERAQAALLDACAADPSAQTLESLLRLVPGPGYGQLDVATQVAVAKALGSLPAVTAAARRQLLLELAACPGMIVLEPRERLDLVEWSMGPELAARAAPMRRSRLDLAWNARREELIALLASRAFRRAAPLEEAETLRDFLHQQTRTVWFLNATEINGHAVVVFGDPADPRSICYGRRWILGDRRPVAKVMCPDPSVQSGWQHPAADGLVPYAAQKVALSRLEERALIGWIEQNYGISDDDRVSSGLGVHAAVPAAAAGMVDAAEETLRRLQSRRGPAAVESLYLRAGRPTQAPTAGGLIESLLAAMR